MKISTFAFIGSLLAIRLEKVYSDNNEVNRQHRKDEEVVSVDEIVGESSIGSVRAGRRNDRDKGNKRQQRNNKRTDVENEKPEKKDLNGNKRGSNETDKSDGKRGGRGGGGGRRGGRNADDNEESPETNDEKRGGRGGRGGGDDGGNDRKNNKRGNRVGQGSTSGHHKKYDNKKKQRIKEGRKFRKRLDLEGEQVTHTAEALVSPYELVGGVPPPAEIVPPLAEEEVGYVSEEESHTMDKKLMGKSEKEPPVEAEVEEEMMKKGDNLMAKSFKESVHKGPHEKVPTGTASEGAKHEMKKDDNIMAKSVKESVHKGPQEQIPIPTETTYESSNNIEASANKFASGTTSKRKQRHEKPSREWRRRNHPRQPPPPPGGNNGGRFAVPSAAKQRTPGKQRHGGLSSKNDKMAP